MSLNFKKLNRDIKKFRVNKRYILDFFPKFNKGNTPCILFIVKTFIGFLSD